MRLGGWLGRARRGSDPIQRLQLADRLEAEPVPDAYHNTTHPITTWTGGRERVQSLERRANEGEHVGTRVCGLWGNGGGIGALVLVFFFFLLFILVLSLSLSGGPTGLLGRGSNKGCEARETERREGTQEREEGAFEEAVKDAVDVRMCVHGGDSRGVCVLTLAFGLGTVTLGGAEQGG